MRCRAPGGPVGGGLGGGGPGGGGPGGGVRLVPAPGGAAVAGPRSVDGVAERLRGLLRDARGVVGSGLVGHNRLRGLGGGRRSPAPGC
ncbi:hypothetical protein DQ226_08790 [Dietzia maris]|uniref:Uncharacterized protein n=1 Tax=Dietzia maris TaxID=37915 RepID=A0A365PA59_9ACTN|nr:hypothetical protein DQ226_08790 [Dietzia maris]HBD22109.1 hypothetical protein [Dietzia sp.]